MTKYFDPTKVDVERLYAGIGSRKTPRAVGMKMIRLAIELEDLGWWQFSGGAEGADQYFEEGCIDHTSLVPWNGFEGRPMLHRIHPEAFDIARRHHDYWGNMSQGVRKLMARNTMQVLSPFLVYPVKFVVCWTPDGCTCKLDRDYDVTGGTGQAIAVADTYGIPVINMYNRGWSDVLSELLNHDFSFIEAGNFTNAFN